LYADQKSLMKGKSIFRINIGDDVRGYSWKSFQVK